MTTGSGRGRGMPTCSTPPASGSTALLQLTWQHLLRDAKLSSSAKPKTHNHQNRWGKEGIKGLEQSPEELAGYWNKFFFRDDENASLESKQCIWHAPSGTSAYGQRGLASNAPAPPRASPVACRASCSAVGRRPSSWGVLRQLWGPRCAWPHPDQQPNEAAVSPHAWWGRHSTTDGTTEVLGELVPAMVPPGFGLSRSPCSWASSQHPPAVGRCISSILHSLTFIGCATPWL